VVARKVWGGNRTVNGARTQQILVSVFRTYYLNPAHSPSRNCGQEADWRPSEAILVS